MSAPQHVLKSCRARQGHAQAAIILPHLQPSLPQSPSPFPSLTDLKKTPRCAMVAPRCFVIASRCSGIASVVASPRYSAVPVARLWCVIFLLEPCLPWNWTVFSAALGCDHHGEHFLHPYVPHFRLSGYSITSPLSHTLSPGRYLYFCTVTFCSPLSPAKRLSPPFFANSHFCLR